MLAAMAPGSRVIDVDAHFEPELDWLDDFPSLKAELPERLPTGDPRFRLGSPEMFAFFLSDDLLRGVPVAERPPIEDMVTPAMTFMLGEQRLHDLVYEGSDQYPPTTPATVDARVAWMDEAGIDHQNAISGGGYTLARVIDDPGLGQRTLEAVNTTMAERLAGHGGRVHPVTCLRYDDLDWTVRELTRMRGLGSRAFLVNAEPQGGISPSSPAFDPVWSAATDLGMIPLLHVGMAPALIHPGWAKDAAPGLIRLLSVLQPDQAAQVYLTALVFGGVFERHPKLTVLISELGIEWVPRLITRLDVMAQPGVSPLVLGEYDLPRTPGEYFRDHVRISPVPALRESPVEFLRTFPEMAVFSSDYPHHEGNGTPVTYYDDLLEGVDATVKAGFLGGNIAAAYDRMGDPL